MSIFNVQTELVVKLFLYLLHFVLPSYFAYVLFTESCIANEVQSIPGRGLILVPQAIVLWSDLQITCSVPRKYRFLFACWSM